MHTRDSTANNIHNITLSPQTVKQRQKSVDDSLTAKDVGVLSAINFFKAAATEDFDLVLAQNIKKQLLGLISGKFDLWRYQKISRNNLF
jgi:hypothetical protein